MLDLPKMTDYEALRGGFRLDVPEHYNFAVDVIDRAANRFANVLRGLGAAPGDFALVMLPRIPAWYEVLVGCIKSGVVAMPGTTLLTPKDIAYRLTKSAARLAVVGAEHADKVDQIRDACPSLKHLIVVGGAREGWVSYAEACAAAADGFRQDGAGRTRARDMMLVYFTSGTTGPPKMVAQDHGYALAHALTGRYWMDLEPDDIHWTLSDTGWAKAAWGTFPPWQMGAATVLYDAASPFDADAHLGLIGRLGVTTFCAPPTAYRIFAQQDLGRYDLGSLRHSIGAGEPLNPEVMRVWRQATGTEIHDGYGQTETVNLVANYPCLPVRPGSMGKPVPGFDVDLVDGDGKAVPTGEIGEIAVRVTEPFPPGLFRGYHGDPRASARSFRHGWYYTGDTATRDAEGYIWFVGRSDDIITSAGYRISPFEVESALLEHPAVAESAVVGKPDPLRGEIVKAYVTLASGFDASDALVRELQDFVKKQTAPYKYPREIAIRDALPKTISGKIRRVELRAAAKAESEAKAG